MVRRDDPRRIKAEEKRQMGVLVGEASRELNCHRWNYRGSTREVRSLLSPEAFRNFTMIKVGVLADVWERETKEKNSKLAWWIKKWKLSQTKGVEGVVIDEEELIKMFGDGVVDPIIYGGLKVSDNVLEYLRLPPGFRRFGTVQVSDIESEVEAVAIKQRWG